MKADIVIIGAGPAGLSFAKSLEKTGLKIVVVEKQSDAQLANPEYDGREIALTHFSRAVLRQFGVWDNIDPQYIAPIKEAKVLDGNSPYALHFDYREVCDDCLGYLVSNHVIRKQLYEAVRGNDNTQLICEMAVDSIHLQNGCELAVVLADGTNISAALVVAADSRFSSSRRNMGISASMQDFGKTAIVCKMKHSKPHYSTAYEYFRYGGTLAVLPMNDDCSSIVITAETNKAADIMALDPIAFAADVEQQLHYKLGEMELVSDRYSYPLVAVYANSFVASRFALIGDAAVGMHPVTAHGFNLGLKGQYILAKEIKNALQCGSDIGARRVLSAYNIKHRKASMPLYLATNALVKLYTNERDIAKIMRKLILRLGNRIIPAKRSIMHQLTEIGEVA